MENCKVQTQPTQEPTTPNSSVPTKRNKAMRNLHDILAKQDKVLGLGASESDSEIGDPSYSPFSKKAHKKKSPKPQKSPKPKKSPKPRKKRTKEIKTSILDPPNYLKKYLKAQKSFIDKVAKVSTQNQDVPVQAGSNHTTDPNVQVEHSTNESRAIDARVRGAIGAPIFGRPVNPAPTRGGADYTTPHITTGLPGCLDHTASLGATSRSHGMKEPKNTKGQTKKSNQEISNLLKHADHITAINPQCSIGLPTSPLPRSCLGMPDLSSSDQGQQGEPSNLDSGACVLCLELFSSHDLGSHNICKFPICFPCFIRAIDQYKDEIFRCPGCMQEADPRLEFPTFGPLLQARENSTFMDNSDQNSAEIINIPEQPRPRTTSRFKIFCVSRTLW